VDRREFASVAALGLLAAPLAKALGLTILPSLLLRADEVIQ
jgi:hypothetical protein